MTFNEENPFAQRSTLPYELPDFTRISNEHYLPAFYEGCRLHLLEVDAIVSQPEVTFENTIVALEKAGQVLNRMLMVFYNKSSSDTSDELDAIEAALSAPVTPGKPKAILAHTVKGKGVSFMEGQVGWHGKAPNEEQRQQALKELED